MTAESLGGLGFLFFKKVIGRAEINAFETCPYRENLKGYNDPTDRYVLYKIPN
jgi:hypothetical protein